MNRMRKRGFTLVEMMVVIFVIGIIITIVVGVAGVVASRANDERSKATMGIVMSAITAYHDAHGDVWPGDAGANEIARCTNLLGQLTSDPNSAAANRLLPLDKASYGGPAGSPYILDGYGKSLDYSATKGAGGGPLLVSAGRDNNYGTGIRSDGK